MYVGIRTGKPRIDGEAAHLRIQIKVIRIGIDGKPASREHTANIETISVEGMEAPYTSLAISVRTSTAYNVVQSNMHFAVGDYQGYSGSTG